METRLNDNVVIVSPKNLKSVNYENANLLTNSSLYEADDHTYDSEFEIKLKSGDSIAILGNDGMRDNDYSIYLSIDAEVLLTKDTIIKSDWSPGEEITTVSIPVGKERFINLSGEYFMLSDNELVQVNKDFNKNYKLAFATPC